MRFTLSEAANGHTYFEIQFTERFIETVATSDTYPTKAEALAAIDAIKQRAATAAVIDS